MKNERESFVLYHNYYNQICKLNLEERGQVVSAIFEYAKTGTVTTEMSLMADIVFSFIKDTLDRDAATYEEKRRKNAINGAKSHKNSVPNGSERYQTVANGNERYPNDNDNDNDNGNGNGNGNDNDNGNDNENDNGNDNGNGNGNGNGNDNEGGCAPLALACDCAEHEENDEIDEPVEPSTEICSAEAPPINDAPHAPLLSEEERRELIKKGLSEGYIDERLQRAVTYARARQKSMFAVLLEWWQTDREKAMRKRSVGVGNGGYGYSGGNGYNGGNGYSGASTQSEPSYDIEKFFEAATKRTLEEVVGIRN